MHILWHRRTNQTPHGVPNQVALKGDWKYRPRQLTTKERIVCKVCERGSMEHRKLFRMSTPVVIVGFIIMVPSVRRNGSTPPRFS